MRNESWNLPAPPGFRGLDPNAPITMYRRHLPHWRQDGATYFVTFRLADSLPQVKLRELEALKKAWGERSRTDCQSVPRASETGMDCQSVLQDEEEFARKVMRQVEEWLDQGIGECWLKRPDVRLLVVDALHHFDNDRYELGCYVIMSNHVHLVIRPLNPREHPLEKILQGRKMHTSRNINLMLGQGGTLWQEESFDRIIRDEEHLWRCIQYIGRNPKQANLSATQWTRWVRPSWQECGWSFGET